MEQHIEKLEGSQEDREQAMMELVLAKQYTVPPLIKALEDEEKPSGVRVDIATVLFRIYMRERDPTIWSALLSSLQDRDPRLRSRMVTALGDIGDKEGIGPLFERLDDPDEEVIYQTLLALESLRDKMEEGARDSLMHQAIRLAKTPVETENSRKIRQKAEELPARIWKFKRI